MRGERLEEGLRQFGGLFTRGKAPHIMQQATITCMTPKVVDIGTVGGRNTGGRTSMKWKATAGRLTLFPTVEASKRSAKETFELVIGAEPSGYDGARQTAGISTARGTYEGFALTCTTQPLRIDFILSVLIDPNSFVPGVLPLIEDAESLRVALNNLRDLIVSKSDSLPSTRVAFSMQLTSPVGTLQEGNALISKTVPEGYALPLADENEVIFQMNRPRQSERVPTMRLNFLTRWSLDVMKVLAIPASGQAGQTHSSHQSIGSLVTDFTVVNIALDNNTMPQTVALSSDELSAALHELLDNAPNKNSALVTLGEG